MRNFKYMTTLFGSISAFSKPIFESDLFCSIFEHLKYSHFGDAFCVSTSGKEKEVAQWAAQDAEARALLTRWKALAAKLSLWLRLSLMSLASVPGGGGM